MGVIVKILQSTRPIVGAAARLHHNHAPWGMGVAEFFCKFAPRQAVPADAIAMRTKDMYLKHVLGQIHGVDAVGQAVGWRVSIHVGLLLATVA